MNKEEYTSEITALKVKVELLNSKFRDLRKQYIDSNSLFKIEEKVIATLTNGVDEIAYVIGYELSYFNDVKPILAKAKKDGTMSKLPLPSYCVKTVRKYE